MVPGEVITDLPVALENVSVASAQLPVRPRLKCRT